MQPQSTAVACAACGSRAVVAMDAADDPACMLHRALELGGRDGAHGATLELLETIVAYAVESGLVNQDDAARGLGEAIAAGELRRQALELRAVPALARTVEEIDALGVFARLDEAGS